MNRREFITLVSSLVAWPVTAPRSQRPAMPLIGFLNAGARDVFAPRLGAFWRGLSEKAAMSRSNIAGQRASSIGFPRWQPTWFAAMPRSSPRHPAILRTWHFPSRYRVPISLTIVVRPPASTGWRASAFVL
jgi:hypothetical protein